MAEAEVTGKFVHESAQLSSGANTGIKSESTVRIYIDGDAEGIAEGATYHVELQGYNDSKANHSSSAAYTQRDSLREAYVDMEQGDWSIRAGKQQVVWGTADGMKLLDMINPTDYAEMAQNQMEDSRIPVWMVNAEMDNIQVVISQPKENVFAGLNRGTATGIRTNANTPDELTTGNGTDTGNAFLMMGPDSITGEVNGFLNIAPDLGSIAAGFGGQFTNQGLKDYKHFTVNAFNTSTNEALGEMPFPSTATSLAFMIGEGDGTGLDGAQIMGAFATPYNTNLIKADTAADFGVVKDSAFEYMGNTTFSTFDAFWNARSEYTYNMPSDNELDFAIKTSQTTKSGANYSLNFSNSYDKNPIITTTWRGSDGGLLTQVSETNYFMFNGTPVTDAAEIAAGNFDYPTESLYLEDADGNSYGGVAVAGADGEMGSMDDLTTQGYMADNDWGKSATLRMEQSVVKTKNFGGSFDTSFNNSTLGPVVVRGEVLYTQDGKQPVMDKARLSVGDLPGALTMVDADRFKYVLGVDITVLTNMLVSGQYITDRNLDFIDGDQDTGRYTADYATMHLSNGFNKGIEDKQFYSLFFSKPFGESGQHRWNNITMYEEGNGNWNRFDIDYSIDDDTQATLEYNKYWGNVNTQFGQLKNASNIQVGVKYSF
jgi:hypothetical protein